MYFLAIQNTYDAIEIALHSEEKSLHKKVTLPKTEASKLILVALHDLLVQNQCSLSNITFIAANQGPGPFTTLRVVIATINGLSFANTIPLIGVNGLEAFLTEHISTDYPVTVALLNAFNRDVYFGIAHHTTMIQDGYHNIHLLLADLKQRFEHPVRFIGNAVELYKEDILLSLGARAFIPEKLPSSCSLEQIATMGLDRWKQRLGMSFQLMPLYLKPFNGSPHAIAKTPQS